MKFGDVKTADPDAGLDGYKRKYAEAADLTAESRTRAETCIDYYDGNQLTREEKAILNRRRQPIVINNRVRVAVNGILGVTAKGRSEPRAWPRTPDDMDSADVATDVLRYCAEENRFNALKLQCFRDMLIPGSMAAIVEVDRDLKPVITQIRWEEFFHDARARRNDFGDARYVGIAKWRHVRDVEAEYPGCGEQLRGWMDAPMAAGSEDRPQGASWRDGKDGRLLVVEMYALESQWMRVVFYGGGVLSRGVSPYVDARGEPCNPIEAQSAYVDRDNGRYGVVVDMLGLQDEINRRRSRLLHLISNSQVQAVDERAFAADRETAREEARKADGALPPGWQRVPTVDLASGQSELLNDAYMNIERMGPNPAVLGRTASDASGRALLARQQAGLTELAIVYDGLDDWELRIYRQIWARVKQYWRAPQYVRVTDDVEAPRYVLVNEPVRGVEGTGGPVLGYRNALAEMDVDIVLDTQPETGSLQQEQFEKLVAVLGSNPGYAQAVPFDVMVELASLPNKRRLLDRLKRAREERTAAGQQGAQAQMQAAQAQQQMALAQHQVAMATAQAELEKTRSETMVNLAKAGAGPGEPAQVEFKAGNQQAMDGGQ